MFFFHSKISIFEWFLKYHVMLILKIQLIITEINYILKDIQIDFSLIVIIYHNVTVFIIFLSNKCSLDEYK